MNNFEEPFRPETIDEQIEQLSRRPHQPHQRYVPGGRTVNALRHLIEEDDEILEHAWERIITRLHARPNLVEPAQGEHEGERGFPL